MATCRGAGHGVRGTGYRRFSSRGAAQSSSDDSRIADLVSET